MRPAVERRRSDSSRRAGSASAFTLLELLAAVGIIAALAAMSFGFLRAAKERTAIARTRAELAVLLQGLEEFKRHYGDYPAATSATDSPRELFEALTGTRGPRGVRVSGPHFVEISRLTLARDPRATPAMNSNAFVDPWGTPYVYVYPTVSAPAETDLPILFSAGPDSLVGPPFRAPEFLAAEARHAGVNADNIYAGETP